MTQDSAESFRSVAMSEGGRYRRGSEEHPRDEADHGDLDGDPYEEHDTGRERCRTCDAIASWCTLAHDLVTSGLGAFGAIDQRAYEDAMSSPTPFRTLIWTLMIGYAAAFITLFSMAVASIHRLGRTRATVVGTLAFVAYQGVFVLFNR